MPSFPFADEPVLTAVTRSGRVESWHRGTVAVWHSNDLLLAAGDPNAEVICRSATKPLQALPFLERGLDRRFQLDDKEVAVMCASHDGAEIHTTAVRSFLKKASLHEGQLGCGPHAPFDSGAREALRQQGQKPMRVHNNCSGKHTGFLCLARECGDALGSYLDPSSKSQREVAAAVAAMASVQSLPERGTDGCGAPTFVLPLVGLARAFARLANPSDLGSVRRAACERIHEAVRREPSLVAGQQRLCTALLKSVPAVRFAKNGAEGVYAVALAPDPSRVRCPHAIGIAVKIGDGSDRGYLPVVVDLLLHLGALPHTVPAPLVPFHVQTVKNTRDQEVGFVRCVHPWGEL